MENKIINVTIPNLGIINIYFEGRAKKIIDFYENVNEFERQKSIKHLGLISTVFEGSSHSRYDYVMLQCALVDLVDNLHKGSSNLSLGNLKVDGQNFSGNSIMKSWFLLSNFGHTKYTYGDEKALILFSIKTKGFKSLLLRPIKDKELKAWCNKVIREYDYSNMHYVIAIRRIYKETYRDVKTRQELIETLKLLLVKNEKIEYKVNLEKLEQLKRVFNIIRKLSIISIDGHYSHVPINIDLIASIVSLGSIEKIYNNKSLVEQVEPIISILHNELYLNKSVLEIQRNYEIEAQNVISGYFKKDIDNLINIALNDGLIPKPINKLTHFTRLKIGWNLQSNNDFRLELNELAKVRTGCRDTDYNIDYNPISKNRYIDFFIKLGDFTHMQLPALIYNISNYIYQLKNVLENNLNYEIDIVMNNIIDLSDRSDIDRQELLETISQSKSMMFNELDAEHNHEILPLFKELFWSVLRYFIKEKYSWDIDIQTKKYAQFLFNADGTDADYLNRSFDIAIEKEDNKDRKFEIKQLKKSATRKFDGYILACLSRITLYDMTKKPSERLVTDIDSALLKVRSNKLILELNEAKNVKRNAENKAKKDLRDKFIKVLNENSKGYRISDIKGSGAKLVININSN